LAIDLDARLVQAVDEAAIGQAVLAGSRVDALDPQGAEIALAVLAVAVGVLQRLFDRLLGDADGVLATTVKALGGLQDLLVLDVAATAALYANAMISSISLSIVSDAAAVTKKILDDLLGIGSSHTHGAESIANELVGTLDHAVALAGSCRQDFPGT